jgi:hypothetical protein
VTWFRVGSPSPLDAARLVTIFQDASEGWTWRMEQKQDGQQVIVLVVIASGRTLAMLDSADAREAYRTRGWSELLKHVEAPTLPGRITITSTGVTTEGEAEAD